MKPISNLTRYALAVCSAAAMLAGCGGPASSSGPAGTLPSRLAPESRPPSASLSKITHVVIIIQENRTVDDLFAFLPGANTRSFGLNSQGQTVQLQAEPLTAGYDLGHHHRNWQTEYDNGAMDGFDLDFCKGRSCSSTSAYGYVPQREVQPYYTMAETYAFGDEMFQTNEGPSFPAHQYLIRGTSAISDGSNFNAEDNPTEAGGGCDSRAGSTVPEIDITNGRENASTYPCFTVTSLPTELDAANISWRYYQAKPGAALWNAVDAIEPIWSDKTEYDARVIAPSAQILSDIAGDQLPSVAWVTPTALASDHASTTDGSGPSWVASIVNAIGKSRYWNDTAIFVTWDDWGGWYDHVIPPRYNEYELGFRVPLLVISPYAKSAYISHQQHEFGSILKFTEEVFDLPSLQTTDARSDDLSDCFNFYAAPAKFKRIAAKYSAKHFLSQPSAEPDD
ncbi:MAG: alkaline phosphatase family protein [Candidatus Cybelea sp.]